MPETLQEMLFPHDDQHTYAVIDGASCEELLERLDEFSPRHYCLYTGELDPDVEEVAPYVVELLPAHPFTEWLLSNGEGQPWGIYARSPVGLRAMRKHFRTFMLVKSPEGRTIYFRYYDPRVLNAYLPTTNEKERGMVFGPVSTYLAALDTGEFACYEQDGPKLVRQKLAKPSN